jgi:hypothetical protein
METISSNIFKKVSGVLNIHGIAFFIGTTSSRIQLLGVELSS